MITPQVVSISEPEIATCAAVLGQAFHEDPLQIHVLPDPATRQQVSPRQFEASLRYGWLYGSALTTGGSAEADVRWRRVA